MARDGQRQCRSAHEVASASAHSRHLPGVCGTAGSSFDGRMTLAAAPPDLTMVTASVIVAMKAASKRRIMATLRDGPARTDRHMLLAMSIAVTRVRHQNTTDYSAGAGGEPRGRPLLPAAAPFFLREECSRLLVSCSRRQVSSMAHGSGVIGLMPLSAGGTYWRGRLSHVRRSVADDAA